MNTNELTEAASLESIDRKVSELLKQTGRPRQRFLSIEDAAAYTGLSTKSIRRLLSAGKLTPRNPVRRKIVLDREEIDAYVLASTPAARHGRGKPRGAK